MDVTPSDLPFRKLDADRHFDALAYCPVCRTTEVQIVRTFTAHVNLTAVSDANGFHVEACPIIQDLAVARNYNRAGPWQFVLNLRCGNQHEFRIQFFTDKGLTWAEVEWDGHCRVPMPKQSSQPPTA
jgi:hypothetical protein